MSSRREVLIRILMLLQRKTLIKPKNRTLKCLKRHYLTVQSMKNVAVLTEDGAFALFLRPHPGEFDSSSVPTPREFAIQGKKKANARESARGGGLGAGGIDWCIMCASIKALNGQTTTKTATLGKLNSRSCKYAHTLGTIWKIREFPHPAGSTANTSFHLMKWSEASSWTGFNSGILEKPLSKANCTAPRKALSNSLPSSTFFFVWSFFEPKNRFLGAPREHSRDSANESSC